MQAVPTLPDTTLNQCRGGKRVYVTLRDPLKQKSRTFTIYNATPEELIRKLVEPAPPVPANDTANLRPSASRPQRAKSIAAKGAPR